MERFVGRAGALFGLLLLLIVIGGVVLVQVPGTHDSLVLGANATAMAQMLSGLLDHMGVSVSRDSTPETTQDLIA